MTTTTYDVPSGRIGRRFVQMLANEFKGVRERRWNSERPLIFANLILQTTPEVRRSRDIRRRLEQRMDLWDKGLFSALLDDVEAEVGNRLRSRQPKDEEARAKSFHARVLSGRLRSAVRNVTNRGGGGVLSPDDLCTKTCKPVLEVLESKHPEMREPNLDGSEDSIFENYDAVPDAVPLSITTETVETVAGKLAGAAGCSGTDAVDLCNWLLRHGTESEALRLEMAEMTNWLANHHPPWAAYRALMACRLVALDKQPGVCPVGIGEVYRRLMAKCVISVTGHHATTACGNLNLCAGLPAGIEGAIHAVEEVWNDVQPNDRPISAEEVDADQPLTQFFEETAAMLSPERRRVRKDMENMVDAEERRDGEVPAVLLADARNGFNELGRKTMLWTVRHRWAAGARFAFNCYRHSAQLMIRRDGEPCSLILSREGVTQGDPLSMILYGIALLPLAELIRDEVPDMLQAWYADDADNGGWVEKLGKGMTLLQKYGPLRGYFPEPEKIIIIVRPEDQAAAKRVLGKFNFRYEEGYRYVGGFIGTEAARTEWLEPQIEKWIGDVKTLGKIARKFPQTAFAGLSKSLQQEWQYIQRVLPSTGPLFKPVEEALATDFLPALLEEEVESTALLRKVLALPAKFAGLGVPDPTQTAAVCHDASLTCTRELARSLVDRTALGTQDYIRSVRTVRQTLRGDRMATSESRLKAILADETPGAARRLTRAKDTGNWLTAMPNSLNGTVLSTEEFRDSLRLRYGHFLKSIPPDCDGCGARFTPEHALSCKKGGLVLLRHNDVAAEWHELCARALTPSAVSDEPLIHTGRDTGARRNATTAVAPSMGSGSAEQRPSLIFE